MKMNKGFSSILIIGDELLIGQITDTNSVWIGQELNMMGWEIRSKETVGDKIPAIIEAMSRMADKDQVVLVTGGLGPTSDDRTLEAMSHFFEKPLVLFPEVRENIQDYFTSRGRKVSDHHRKQFYLPEGVEILENKVGTAPGMYMQKDGTHFFFTPGVPVELRYIFEHHIQPKLIEWLSGTLVQSRLFTAGIGETDLVDRLGEGLEGWPSDLSIAYLPYLGGVRLRLTANGVDRTQNEAVISRVQEDLISRLGHHYISSDHGQWNEIIQEIMIRSNLTLGTAESCTGGYIASRITEVPGSSGYFTGTVVSYSNMVKSFVLKVNQETLDTYGAVSKECAQEMLEGLLTLLSTDVGIAVTGIAGPGGGSEEKPVGTVFVSVGNKEKSNTVRFNYRSSRQGIVEYTYHQAMYMVYKFLSTQ